ncbi:MAG: T9SS type A sorting domain-containing protein [Ignavibacteriaceae bacterium]|nr:T9SS type A sorting domain-containing protein [Ignavibacteriaceae bacterium]
MKKVFTFLFVLFFAALISAQDWTSVTTGLTGDIWGIDYANANVVWVSASNGEVAKSVDGGTTWTVCAANAGDGSYAICALSDMAAIVVTGPGSGDGKIVKTTDGGATWNQVYTAAGAWFNFVDNISSTELWALSDPIGGNFHIVKSMDGGSTWAPIATPVPSPATNVFGAVGSFYRIGNVCWFGTGGSSSTLGNRVYKSVGGPDGPWTFATTSAQSPGTIAFSSPNGNGVTGFWNQTTLINRTTDGGATWALQASQIGNVNGMEYIPTTSTTFAATATGIWKSTDDGVTWTQSQIVSNMNVIKAFGDQNMALSGGTGGILFKSAMPSLFPTTFTHNTGTGNMQLGVFNDGYIGHDFTGGTGGGLIFNSKPDAMYTGGMIFGTPLTGVVGIVGSFTDGGTPSVPIIADFENSEPLVGPTSNPMFDQVTNCAYSTNAISPLAGKVYQEVLSNTGEKFVFYHYTLMNTTASQMSDVRVGVFADLDVGGANYASNSGGVDASRNVAYQYLNMASPNDPNYYGVVALGGLTGAKLSSVFPGTGTTIRNEIFTYISSVDNTPITTNGDYRIFAGSGPYAIPAGGSVEVWFAIVAGTSLADMQANADAAMQKYYTYVPVEMTSFTAAQVGNVIRLDWQTATETNNQGFEIQRKVENNEWTTIGYKNGNGTTTEPTSYSFEDNLVAAQSTNIQYRLKQIDFNGVSAFSNVIEVEYNVPLEFNLAQNYPNPFNPSTTISFRIPEADFITLKVFNALGEEVVTLVNGFKQAGAYNIQFNASNIPSGIYFYSIKAGNNAQFSATKKMMLIK